jgi:hypothetical protein
MKNIASIVMIIGILFISCRKEDNTVEKRVSIEKANQLITDWVFDEYNPGMNPSFTFDSIVELTNDEIFSKLSGQVFSVRSMVPGLMNRWLFIKKNIVYDLHGFHYDQYARDSDAKNLVVTDLNNDRVYELCYTAFWGSGFIRSVVNCFYLSGENIPYGSGIDISINASGYGCQFDLQKEDYQKLYLKYVKNSYSLKIGEIGLSEGNEMQVIVNLYEGIPQEILDILIL